MRTAISIIFNGAHHLYGPTAKYSQIGKINAFFDKWIIIEGASKSTFCTSWCKSMPNEYHNNGSSVDDTIAILSSLQRLQKGRAEIVVVKANGLWDGKVSMFNRALEHVTEPCWLWQVDIDEHWTEEQLTNSETVLKNLNANVGCFACDYLLTDEIIVRGTWGESNQVGYTRLWNYEPGRKFIAHEPPIIEGLRRAVKPELLPRFTHLSYYYEKDVIFKSKWYGGHENIYTGWKNIISGVTKLPCPIQKLFDNNVPKDWESTIITYR